MTISNVTDLDEITKRVVQINKDNGWSDDVPEVGTPEFTNWLITKLALVMTEIAEGIEEVRKGIDPTETYYLTDSPTKPEGLGSELADAVIRSIHLAYLVGIDLPSNIDEKLTYNATRGYRHGGKAA